MRTIKQERFEFYVMNENNSLALVIFGKDLPKKTLNWWKQFNVVFAPSELESEVRGRGVAFIPIDDFIEPGSIYEASAFAEELSCLTLPDGSRLTKTFLYKGYELWWVHYNSIFLYFCLPYTQHRKLLEYLKQIQSVSFYRPPYKSLFSCYLRAYGCEVAILRERGFKSPSSFPFGVLFQILITFFSILILSVHKRRIMVFTGDKFEKDKDYDFRMKYIYEELRQRKLPFVEFIRSLESWKTVLGHAIKRKRPVIYSEGITFVGRFVSVILGGHRRGRKKFGVHNFSSETDPEKKFKLLVATQYLLGVYDDIWAIRIMKLILQVSGVKAALVITASERNFHAVLGCKLNDTPTVGIQHGVASPHYNVTDFMPGFDEEKMLSVDKYGLWSEWWKEYYVKNSKAYRPEQLYVSGPMRPLMRGGVLLDRNQKRDDLTRVLFVSEQQAVPEEVLPYLNALMEKEGVLVYITFRSYRDNFEIWLKNNHPEILHKFGEDKILRRGIQDAISYCDVVIGSHSTGVLEALLALKPIVFFSTKKYGDYFDLKDHGSRYKFFAENPKDLMDCIMKSKKIPTDALKGLQERFFGDPYRSGSKWVVEQVENILQKTP